MNLLTAEKSGTGNTDGGKQSFFCQSKRRRDTVSYIEFVRDFHTADRIVRGPDLQQPVKRNGYHLSEILLQSCQPGIEISLIPGTSQQSSDSCSGIRSRIAWMA